mmetsp:Transcript_1836/g.6766  ORF Transcript_1836/g.6766 Transcript_1836/m.6766 type:complete len:93 (+) Transcript_1836:1317-1595(+)
MDARCVGECGFSWINLKNFLSCLLRLAYASLTVSYYDYLPIMTCALDIFAPRRGWFFTANVDLMSAQRASADFGARGASSVGVGPRRRVGRA